MARAESPSGLVHTIYKPLLCLVLQGSKTVTMGDQHFHFAGGDSLIVTTDVPTVRQITQASRKQPYLAVVIQLDAAIVMELNLSREKAPGVAPSIIQHDSTDAEVADTTLRIVQLLHRPASIPTLLPAYMRELHYWLLLGRHGLALNRYAMPHGKNHGIGRALATLHEKFAESLSVRSLASEAGMSLSSFHERFRQATASTPLQFQKQLRLIEANRLMSSEGWNASGAALQVGYESVNQFTREYARQFGSPPARHMRGKKG